MEFTTSLFILSRSTDRGEELLVPSHALLEEFQILRAVEVTDLVVVLTRMIFPLLRLVRALQHALHHRSRLLRHPRREDEAADGSLIDRVPRLRRSGQVR